MNYYVDGDIVTGSATGHVKGDVDGDDSLMRLPLDRLRCVDGKIVDAATYTEFWIDGRGRKHVVPGDGWQPLSCAWNTTLVPDKTGKWQADTVTALAVAQGRAESAIDAMADAQLAPYMSLTPGRAMTYLAKETQARAYLAATDPDPASYPLINGEVGITADTPKAVAETVVAMSQAWHAMGAAIEAVRLAAKKQVRQASTPEAVQDVLAGLTWPKPE